MSTPQIEDGSWTYAASLDDVDYYSSSTSNASAVVGKNTLYTVIISYSKTITAYNFDVLLSWLHRTADSDWPLFPIYMVERQRS